MSTLESILAEDYVIAVDERFDGTELDPRRWIPYYLPHWAGRERAAARYRLEGGHLELSIDDDQPFWHPEVTGNLRVSSLQTGVFSGPVGSAVGQHRTDSRLRVVEAQAEERLITPHYAAIEMRARWTPHPDHMVALWLIGFEDRPHRSAEICICEIFGSEARGAEAVVGMGVRPFSDPTITDDFAKVPFSIDVREPHDYAAVWTDTGVAFFIDGQPVHSTGQSPDYPMQLMLNIYDLGTKRSAGSAAPFIVEHIRVHVPSTTALM